MVSDSQVPLSAYLFPEFGFFQRVPILPKLRYGLTGYHHVHVVLDVFPYNLDQYDTPSKSLESQFPNPKKLEKYRN